MESFPVLTTQKKFIFVAIDYFSKWIEIEDVASITNQDISRIFQKHVIHRFGIPRVVISDNGIPFTRRAFQNLCFALSIEHRFTSVAHPQFNGSVEAANKVILHGLRTKIAALSTTKGKTLEFKEFPKVVTHQEKQKSSNDPQK